DQVPAASHAGPCMSEVGNKHLESRGVETVAQGCHVFELVERIVDRWVAAAPEAPAFLGTEFIHRQRQMVRPIPLIEFRALALIWHLRSNHEIGFACLHVRSSCKKSRAPAARSSHERRRLPPDELPPLRRLRPPIEEQHFYA